MRRVGSGLIKNGVAGGDEVALCESGGYHPSIDALFSSYRSYNKDVDHEGIPCGRFQLSPSVADQGCQTFLEQLVGCASDPDAQNEAAPVDKGADINESSAGCVLSVIV